MPKEKLSNVEEAIVGELYRQDNNIRNLGYVVMALVIGFVAIIVTII